MSKADRVTIHDGRGHAFSLDKPPSGGEVRVDFQGHIVCLKSVDHYGIVREQVCVPISQPPQPSATSGSGSGSGGSSTGGCGCP